MLLYDSDNVCLFIGRELRPVNLYFLLSVLFNPDFRNSITNVGFLATTASDVYVPSVLICIRWEYRENEAYFKYQDAVLSSGRSTAKLNISFEKSTADGFESAFSAHF